MEQPWWQQRAAWLHACLLEGRLGDVPVRLVDLGALELTTGELVAGDPYLLHEPEPFRQRLAPGTWTVRLAQAEVGPDHLRVAAALLTRDAGPVVAWEMGLVAEQDPARLGEEEYFGYGVDAGTGCFADLADVGVLVDVLAEDAGMLEDPVSRAREGSELHAAVAAPRHGARPVAVFASGWGDGSYPTWFGRDASGEVVLVVTDMLLVDDPFAAEPAPEEPAPPPSRWRRLLDGLRR